MTIAEQVPFFLAAGALFGCGAFEAGLDMVYARSMAMQLVYLTRFGICFAMADQMLRMAS